MSSISSWAWTSVVLGIGAVTSLYWLFFERHPSNKSSARNLQSNSKVAHHIQVEQPDEQPILRQSFLPNLITRVRYPLESTTIVTRHSEWEKAFIEISKDCAAVPILGLDCEWVNTNYQVKPVALIQLASHSGKCILVRMCYLGNRYFPKSLANILEDEKILKVGVDIKKDVQKLFKDFRLNVRRSFDVRDLISRHQHSRILAEKPGIAGLSQQLLEVTLSKNLNITCSDWEAPILTEDQVKYAAQDALASLAICLKMVSDISLIKAEEENDLASFYTTWSRTVIGSSS